MSTLTGNIYGPFFENILRFVRSFVEQPLTFREQLARNAAYALYFDRQTAITGSTQYLVEEAQSGAEAFTAMFISFDTASGSGRYMVTSDLLSATVGFEVPAGSSFLSIEGHQNIKAFRLMAEAGQTLIFSRVLFR